MNRSVLLSYQWATGLSDTCTGILLCVAPALTLRMMGVHAPESAVPYVGYVGAFVLAVGISCLYGAYVLHLRERPERIETVWLLTAFFRAAVAVYLVKGILAGEFETAWLGVVLFDGACVLVQATGLHRKWLRHAS